MGVHFYTETKNPKKINVIFKDLIPQISTIFCIFINGEQNIAHTPNSSFVHRSNMKMHGLPSCIVWARSGNDFQSFQLSAGYLHEKSRLQEMAQNGRNHANRENQCKTTNFNLHLDLYILIRVFYAHAFSCYSQFLKTQISM